MYFEGIIVGAAVFLIIGICHPIVIKLEYHYGKQSWWVMALAGAIFACASLFVANTVLSTVLGAAAFSCFWGIHEIITQENLLQQFGHVFLHEKDETRPERGAQERDQ